MADTPITKVAADLIERMKEPLGLDRWTIKVEFGPGDDTASCAAMPEYKTALVSLDPDKLDTGDALDEILAHELTHPGIWPIAGVADAFAVALAESAPETMRAALARLFREMVRVAEEDSATTVGQNYIRVLRRLWQAEADLASARAEIKALKKQAAA